MQVFNQRENIYKNAYNNIDAWRREYQDSFNTMLTDEDVKDFIREEETMSKNPRYIEIKNKIFSDNRIFYLKLLDILLKAGADVNIKQQFGISDLMFATELGDIELFELLAKHNPNIETMTDKGKNLFTNAMDYGNYDLAFYLLKEYPYFRKDIDYCSKDIQESSKISSLLGKFLEKHNIEKIKEMIEMGANINSKTAMKGITALIIAIETEDEDFIKFVLKKGADVNIKIQNKYLAIPGYFEYLEKYGNFADTANNGITPLMKACIIENLGIVKLLIEDYGAEINAKNDIQKWTALDFAIFTKNIEIIEYLKSKGAVSGIN